MRLANRELLAHYLVERDLKQAQLARRVGLSRQMIWALIHTEQCSCTAEKAIRIELAVGAVRGELFPELLNLDTNEYLELCRSVSDSRVAA